MKNKLNTGFMVLLGSALAVGATGCSKSSSSAAAPTTTPPGSQVTNLAISGVVSSLSAVESQKANFAGHGHKLHGRDSTPTNACASGSFTGQYVGGGGTQVASGSISDGTFTIPSVPEGQELLLTLACSGLTQTCLVKSGDTGVSCDAVSAAVAQAFAASLGISLTDPSLNGKPIAKLAASIDQAAQNNGAATQAFNNAITLCQAETGSTQTTCYTNAITASPFAGTFAMMKTMVSGWKDNNDTAPTGGAKLVSSVEPLYTLLVDVMGGQVQVDSTTFSPLGAMIDTALSTHFVHNTALFISDLINNPDNHIVSLQCSMSYNKANGGGHLFFSPTMQTVNGISQPVCVNQTFFSANGFSAAGISMVTQLAEGGGGGGNITINAAYSSPSQTSNCNNGGPTPTGAVCVNGLNLVMVSKHTEVDRNNPDGVSGQGDFYNPPSFSMINVFPSFMTALENGAASSGGCYSVGDNGPNINGGTHSCANNPNASCNSAQDGVGCATWFVQDVIAPNAQAFSGLIGVYNYLTNPSVYGSSVKSTFSLNDLHTLFTSSSFMNSKLGIQAMNIWGAQIGGGGNNMYLPGLVDPSGSGYTVDPAFVSSGFSSGNQSISTSQAQASINADVVSLALDFGMFENIPTADVIHSYVFGSAYHTEWNPTGNKLFFASSIQTTGLPIFCKMLDSTTNQPTERPLDANIVINCATESQLATALGVSTVTPPDANGNMTLPPSYPYTLQNYGFQGNGAGSVFALADATTGFMVQANGQPILVYQVASGNPNGTCAGGAGQAGGAVVTAELSFGFGSGTSNQATNVYCLDMTNLANPTQYNFLQGGNQSVTFVDPNTGNTNSFQVPLVGYVATGSQEVYPACYFLDETAISISSSTGYASSGTGGSAATISGSGILTPASTDKVDVCTASHTGLTKFYLTINTWGGVTETSLTAHLMSSSNYQQLQWENWTNSGDANVQVTAEALNAKLTGYVVDNSSASVNSVQLLNQQWNAKFDPYCDDQLGQGYCGCTDSNGNALPAAQCTLEDEVAQPTLSQSPYQMGSQDALHTNFYNALFTQMGNASGAALNGTISFKDNSGVTQTVHIGDQYTQTNNLWINNQNFTCLYEVGSETTLRSPQWINFGQPNGGGGWTSALGGNQQGCPLTAGAAASSGPIRLINPIAMQNAYAVSRPNGIIKLVNYATKTVGQGVTIDPSANVFAFDEALALLLLRQELPAIGTVVDLPNSSTPILGALPYFQQVIPASCIGFSDVNTGGAMDAVFALMNNQSTIVTCDNNGGGH
jgi:hypothetical protein